MEIEIGINILTAIKYLCYTWVIVGLAMAIATGCD